MGSLALKGELSSFTTVCAEFTNHLFGCNFQLANAVQDFIKTNRIPKEMIVNHKNILHHGAVVFYTGKKLRFIVF